jgi:hypothetical protein
MEGRGDSYFPDTANIHVVAMRWATREDDEKDDRNMD